MTKRNETILTNPPAPEPRLAYLVRAVSLKWQARQAIDGAVIVERDDRAEAAHEARQRGFILTR